MDLTVEKQVLIPQVKVRLNHRKAAQHGLTPGQALQALETLDEGQRVSTLMDGAPL